MLVTGERPLPVLIVTHEPFFIFSLSYSGGGEGVTEWLCWEPHVQTGSSYHTAGSKPRSKLSNVSFAVDSNHYLSP